MSEEAGTVATAAWDPGKPEAPAPPLEDGDREMILGSLASSPEERLAVLQDFVDTFWTAELG